MVHSGEGQRLPLGVFRSVVVAAAMMVHSLERSSLDIVVVAAADVVEVDIVVVDALLDRSPPEDSRLAFHNIVMDSTSCAIRYLFAYFFPNSMKFHFPPAKKLKSKKKPSTLNFSSQSRTHFFLDSIFSKFSSSH